MATDVRPTEIVNIDALRPHPRNYRKHPTDQIEHLEASIREHGFYRNIVTTTDGTILAGHGIVTAARRLGIRKVPVVRMPIEPDSPTALKILAADNYLSHFAIDDDRALTELLREIHETDTLLGTGFDDEQLALLAMVTRPASEIADFDAAAEWAGMPAYEQTAGRIALTLHFDSTDERDEYIRDQQIIVTHQSGWSWSAHWPPADRLDLVNVLIDG